MHDSEPIKLMCTHTIAYKVVSLSGPSAVEGVPVKQDYNTLRAVNRSSIGIQLSDMQGRRTQ